MLHYKRTYTISFIKLNIKSRKQITTDEGGYEKVSHF